MGRGSNEDDGKVGRVGDVGEGQVAQEAAAGVAAVRKPQAGTRLGDVGGAATQVDEHKNKLDIRRQPVQVQHDALVILAHDVALALGEKAGGG